MSPETLPENDSSPSPDDREILRGALGRAFSEIAAREAVPFDGVLGIPPAWVPPREAAEFRADRGWLLDNGYTRDEILGVMDEDDATTAAIKANPGNPNFHRLPNGAPEATDRMRWLAHFRRCVRLGKKKGLAAMLGAQLATGARRGEKVLRSASDAGRKRAETFGPERDAWRNKASEILKARKRKLSCRELARLVARELHPELTQAEQEKLADSRRRWLSGLLE